MKGDYEEFHALKEAKNKANSKPIGGIGRKSGTRWVGRNFPVCWVLISSALPAFALIFIKENI